MKRTLVTLSIGIAYGAAPVPRAVFWWPPYTLRLYRIYGALAYLGGWP